MRVSWLAAAAALLAVIVVAVGIFVAGRESAPDRTAAAPKKTPTPTAAPPRKGSITVRQYRAQKLKTPKRRVLARLGPPAEPTDELTQGERLPEGSDCVYYLPKDLPDNTGFRFCFDRGILVSAAAY